MQSRTLAELVQAIWVGLFVVDRSAFETNKLMAETYRAVADSVPRARHAVVEIATRAGIDRQAVEAARLAVSEAVTNAVLHAYDGVTGPVHVSAAVADDGLAVTVADEGKGIRPRPNNKRLGIGLALMARIADEFAVADRPGGGTRLQMIFRRLSSRS